MSTTHSERMGTAAAARRTRRRRVSPTGAPTLWFAGRTSLCCYGPRWVDFTLWPALVVVLCLTLLPRVKGALIALQWALRMHGFGGSAEQIG